MKYNLENLSNYFINNNNIFKWTINIIENKKLIKKKIKKEEKKVKNNNNDQTKVFYEKDSLFWCFYYMLYGEFDYITSHSSFAVEKQLKIKYIETVRNNKVKLKSLKVKSNYIENNLLCSKIDILTFYVLCDLHNINFILQDTYFFWENNNHNDPNFYIIKIIDKNVHLYVKNYKKEEIIDEIKAKSVQSQLKSKIKTFSNYKLPEIHDICNKLNIKIMNALNKKKTKKVLYNEILEYI